MSRKSAQQPATAYDYRRVIAFTQVMAITDAIDRYKAMKHLAEQWGVDAISLAPALAQHALKYTREEINDALR